MPVPQRRHAGGLWILCVYVKLWREEKTRAMQHRQTGRRRLGRLACPIDERSAFPAHGFFLPLATSFPLLVAFLVLLWSSYSSQGARRPVNSPSPPFGVAGRLSIAMAQPDPDKDEKPIKTLSEEDVRIMQTYGAGPYSSKIKKLEGDLKAISTKVNELSGIKESDTGLAHPSRWDLVSDKQAMQEEQPLQVSRCTKIINPGTQDAKYLINIKQIAKFVVGLGEKVAPTDIEEGMRVG
jgi:hypothetical protein